MQNTHLQFFNRSLREGIIQLWRNKFLSGTTILLGEVILFLLNFVFSIKYFADLSLKNSEARADFSILLQNDLDGFEYEAMNNELKKLDLKATFFEAQNIEGFIIPPRLHLKFNNLYDVGKALDILKKTRYENVIGDWDGRGERDFVNLINKLLKVRNGVKKTSFWLVLLFIGSGILLAFNTFRITLFSRRDEIFIARLVGAEPKFIAGPFLIEGFLLGIGANLIAIITFIFVLREMDVMPGGTIFLYLWNNVFAWQILISGLVGIVGAGISLRKYLSGKFEAGT